jgi:hypothetical protein
MCDENDQENEKEKSKRGETQKKNNSQKEIE